MYKMKNEPMLVGGLVRVQPQGNVRDDPQESQPLRWRPKVSAGNEQQRYRVLSIESAESWHQISQFRSMS